MTGSPVDADLKVASTGVAGCWGGTASVCGGAEVGRVEATATSAVDQASGSALWVAATAGPRVRVDLPWDLELSVRAEAVVPVAYPRIAINGVEVMNPARVAARSSSAGEGSFRERSTSAVRVSRASIGRRWTRWGTP